MITFKYDINKIIQIVNHMLKKNGGRLNYTKLLKLLYIADKEFFRRWDLSITLDSYSSMNNGPVLCKTYDLIKNDFLSPEQTQWNCFFTKEGYDLILVQKNNLPTDLLSKAEIKTLDDISDKFKRYSYGKMIDYVHREDLFPEIKWREAGFSSIELRVEDILDSLGRSPEEIHIIADEITAQRRTAELILS